MARRRPPRWRRAAREEQKAEEEDKARKKQDKKQDKKPKKVTGDTASERASMTGAGMLRRSATCREWMAQHGVRFQPSLGVLGSLALGERRLSGCKGTGQRPGFR